MLYKEGYDNGEYDNAFWTAVLTFGYRERQRVLAHCSSTLGVKEALSTLLNRLGKALYSKETRGKSMAYELVDEGSDEARLW